MRLLYLQEQKGDGHLFIVEIPDWGEVPFKLPSLMRAQQYTAASLFFQYTTDKIAFYEYIFRECVADEDLAFRMLDIPAGVVESVAKLILLLSGTTSDKIEYTEGLFNTFRAEAENNPVTMMKRIICSVFSGYTFKELDKLDYQELVEVFINAEHMMMEAGLMKQPFSFDKPEEKKPVQIPTGGLLGMPSSTPISNAEPVIQHSDAPIGGSGKIDLDVLIADGQKVERQLNSTPSRGEYNLHNSPEYKAKKQALLDKIDNRARR